MWQAEPFSITKKEVISIKGGWLRSEWIVTDVIEIEGKWCLPMSHLNRKLAQSLGCTMSDAAPLNQCSILVHIAELRDAAVDECIRDYQRSKDPRFQISPDAKLTAKARKLSFKEWPLPQLVNITVEECVTSDGQRVPQQSLQVLSTPNRLAIVTLAISAEKLDWLFKAAQAPWPNSKNHKKRKLPVTKEIVKDMPELAPGLHYRWDNQGHLQISGRYKGTNNDRKGVVKTVRPLTKDGTTEEGAEFSVRACEKLVIDALSNLGQ